MKYFLLALLILWWVFSPSRRRKRQLRRERKQQQAQARKAAAAASHTHSAPAHAEPLAMIACAHCGVHLPEVEALHDNVQRAYCSEQHRQLGQTSL